MRSFRRLAWKRAMGTAAEARIARIVMVTINSTRVSPRSPAWPVWIGRASLIDCGFIGSLHLNADPPALGRQLLLLAADRPRPGEDNVARSGGLGLETENADHARAVHPGRSRRTRGVDQNQARTVVAVSEHHGQIGRATRRE